MATAVYDNGSAASRHSFGEGRTEYGEVINTAASAKLHNSPAAKWAVVSANDGYAGEDTIETLEGLYAGLLERDAEEAGDAEVGTLGAYALAGCASLVSASFASVAHVANSAFYGCTALEEVSIPLAAQVDANAFEGCTALEAIELPSAASIGNRAFYGCTALASVTVDRDTPPTLGSDVFYGCAAGLRIYVPAGSVTAYKAAANWSAYSSSIEAIPAGGQEETEE